LTVQRRGWRSRRIPLNTISRARDTLIEALDSSVRRIPTEFLVRGTPARDPSALAGHLGAQFLSLNRGILRDFDVTAVIDFDGSNVMLVLRTGTRIGAIPLLSPSTGRPDLGLLIRPRFEWNGLGSMLSVMGWRILPRLLRLPSLPRSDRKIPPWVLSTVVLVRISALLDRLERKFDVVEEDRSAPRGHVDWLTYATRRITRARFIDVPCSYPELKDDRQLRSGIHFVLLKQLDGLKSQRASGAVVLRLLELCQGLLRRVQDAPPREPSALAFRGWFSTPLRTEAFRDGLQAMEWTIDDRGLAGLSDLQGLSWMKSMTEFFEAWVESVFSILARRVAASIRTGRERQTVTALQWDPPYLGSQKYLLPDVILERGDTTLIVDAKYKEHWEELSERRWHELGEEIQESHRADLLQVLAYANLAKTPRIQVCLAYPCATATWHAIRARGRLFHRASLAAGDRQVELLLTAVPMAGNTDELVSTLEGAVFAT
jgi:hypothetical protein